VTRTGGSSGSRTEAVAGARPSVDRDRHHQEQQQGHGEALEQLVDGLVALRPGVEQDKGYDGGQPHRRHSDVGGIHRHDRRQVAGDLPFSGERGPDPRRPIAAVQQQQISGLQAHEQRQRQPETR